MFLVAFEIWGLVTFHQQCRENLQYVNEMLEVVKENKRNMTRTNDSITALMSDYTNVSRKLHILKNLNYIIKEQHLNILCFLKPIKALKYFTKVGRAAFHWDLSSFFDNSFTAFMEDNYFMSHKRKYVCEVKIVIAKTVNYLRNIIGCKKSHIKIPIHPLSMRISSIKVQVQSCRPVTLLKK